MNPNKKKDLYNFIYVKKSNLVLEANHQKSFESL